MQQIETLKRVYRKDVNKINKFLDSATTLRESTGDISCKEVSPSKRKKLTSIDHDHQEYTPIGYIESCFKTKNGTPRQPTVCTSSKAKLRILETIYNNPAHALQGLEKFSHVWVIFNFHKNGPHNYTKAKVKPPRLDGAKVGLFATRSPHRPSPIGLTLACIDKLEGDTVYLSGVDMIEGTPVLDIKPYIPSYDKPHIPVAMVTDKPHIPVAMVTDKPYTPVAMVTDTSCMRQDEDCSVDPEVNEECRESSCDSQERCQKSWDPDNMLDVTANSRKSTDGFSSLNKDGNKQCTTEPVCDVKSSTVQEEGIVSSISQDQQNNAKAQVASWILKPPCQTLSVRFTPHAEEELMKFHSKTKRLTDDSHPQDYTLGFLNDWQEAKKAIGDILQADPRSTYRRKHCQDNLYYFTVDHVHVTCWFTNDMAEVIRIQPVSKSDSVS
ncbi:tRNA (adenine(37)-N6)-methyltransferase-like [Glandiceps talaboti]